jgi:hypothetical protein
MAIYKTTSCQVILRKVMRDLKPEDANWIDDAVEWIGEALEHIGASAQLVTQNCILDIKDHKTSLPADLYYINQVSINENERYRGVSTNIDKIRVLLGEYLETTGQQKQDIANTLQTLVDGTVTSNLTDTGIQQARELTKTGNSIINEVNTRLAVLENGYMEDANTMLAYCTTNFPEALHCEDCVNRKAKCKECYFVEDGYLKTSFSSGKVCLSYKAFPTDAECYPLVPDDISYKEAMFWYIFKKLLLGGMQPANGFDYMTANQQWQYYCTQARNSAAYPDIDRMESFMNQWVRLIPNINRHDNAFENLGTREELYRGNYSTT